MISPSNRSWWRVVNFYHVFVPHSDRLGLQREGMQWAGLACVCFSFNFADGMMGSDVSNVGELFHSIGPNVPPYSG